MVKPPPFFIVAPWSQPIGNFTRIKAWGCNALIGEELESGTVTKLQWEDAATAERLCFLTKPGVDLLAESKQPFRLAWLQDDEPDNNRWKDAEPATSENNRRLIPAGTFKGWTQPQLLLDRYAACKKVAPDMPVFCNFAGPQLTNTAYDGAQHKVYLSACDWWGVDFHVINWDPGRYRPVLQARCMDRLTQWSNGKPGMLFAEASNQKIRATGREPTPDEFEDEVNLGVACDGRGVLLFCHQFGVGWPAGFIGTTPVLEARIIDVVGRLKRRFTQSGPAPLPDPTAALRVKLAAGLRTVADSLDR